MGVFQAVLSRALPARKVHVQLAKYEAQAKFATSLYPISPSDTLIGAFNPVFCGKRHWHAVGSGCLVGGLAMGPWRNLFASLSQVVHG